jgi:TctA family transporter
MKKTDRRARKADARGTRVKKKSASGATAGAITKVLKGPGGATAVYLLTLTTK